MATISVADVQRLAELACIALSDEEINKLAGELAVITEAVSKVSEVAASDIPITVHPVPLENVFRPDTVGDVLNRAELLASAPESEDGGFKVPQILEEN